MTGSAYAGGGRRDVSYLEPEVRVDSIGRVRRDFRALDRHLMLMTHLGRDTVSDRSVWHRALRTAPADRELTEEAWTDVAVDVLRRTGIWRWEWATQPYGTVDYDSDPGPHACQWGAVRTNLDTLHLVAVLVTHEGRRLSPCLDFPRARAASCEAAERKYGLVRTGRGARQQRLDPAAVGAVVGPA